MNSELSQRIHRIYSSIKAVEETDPNKLKATAITTCKCIVFFQDFRGGLNDAELSNLAHINTAMVICQYRFGIPRQFDASQILLVKSWRWNGKQYVILLGGGGVKRKLN